MSTDGARRLPAEMVELIQGADVLEPVGARTHAEVGNPVQGAAVPLRAPAGIVAYEPADLTVRVRAGTPVALLDTELRAHGQMVAFDPDDSAATVGGVVAAGLSGHRRLRYGPVRDQVLEVRIVGGDGRLRVGGGPTVKNVTGYDVVRLVCGSLGTLGLIWEVVLRCRPAPVRSEWFRGDASASHLRSACHAPSAVVETAEGGFVLLEGTVETVAAEARRAGLEACVAPTRPEGTHGARISVPVDRAPALVAALRAFGPGLSWWSEPGVGTLRVAGNEPETLAAVRREAERFGAWMLREHGGGPGFDGYGTAFENRELCARIKQAFDPRGVFAPGRFPW